MALNENQLYASTDRDPFPRIKPDHQYPKTFGADAAAPELAVGTPLGYNETAETWFVWSNAGTGNRNIVKGFVYPEPVQLHATDEIQGIVMLQGEIHYDDVVLPSGELQANLDAALVDGPMARNLRIQGLEKVR